MPRNRHYRSQLDRFSSYEMVWLQAPDVRLTKCLKFVTHGPSNHIAIPACTASVTQNLSHLCCVPQINTKRQGSRYRTNLIPRLGGCWLRNICIAGEGNQFGRKWDTKAERGGQRAHVWVCRRWRRCRAPTRRCAAWPPRSDRRRSPSSSASRPARARAPRRGSARGGRWGLRWDRFGCGIPPP